MSDRWSMIDQVLTIDFWLDESIELDPIISKELAIYFDDSPSLNDVQIYMISSFIARLDHFSIVLSNSVDVQVVWTKKWLEALKFINWGWSAENHPRLNIERGVDLQTCCIVYKLGNTLIAGIPWCVTILLCNDKQPRLGNCAPQITVWRKKFV